MKLPKIYHTWILKIVPFTALYRVKLFVLIIATSHFWSLTVSLRESNVIYDNWFRTMTLFTTLWYTSVLDSKTQTQRHLLYSLTIKPYTLPWSHVLFNLRDYIWDYIWLILSHVVVPIQGGCNIYPQIQARCVLNPNWFVSGYLCNSTGVHSISQYCSWNRKGIVPGEERNLLSLNLNTYAFYTCSYPRKTQTFGFYRIYRDSNVSQTFVSLYINRAQTFEFFLKEIDGTAVYQMHLLLTQFIAGIITWWNEIMPLFEINQFRFYK